jgi:hypothetical protein
MKLLRLCKYGDVPYAVVSVQESCYTVNNSINSGTHTCKYHHDEITIRHTCNAANA